MAEKIKLGGGSWGVKENGLLAYNDEDGIFKAIEMDFSRASDATRESSAELIAENETGVPRIDFSDSSDGALLLEPQSTNLITYSEDFSNTSWNKGNLTVIVNQAISPDGSQNADEITPDATTGAIRIWQTKTTSTTTYSLSFFVKYNGKQYVQLLFGSLLNSVDFSNFDLINGTVTLGTGEIESYGNGWYKISLTASLNAATDQVYLWSIDSATSSRGASSTGNGSDGYFVWGAQLEQLSYPTSYIRNNGNVAGVTRIADAVPGNSSLGQVINSSEGVLYLEVSALDNDGTTRAISINDGSNDNFVQFSFRPTTNAIRYRLESEDDLQFSNEELVTDSTIFNKFALVYGSNNFSFWVNGVRKFLVTNASTPINLTNLNFDNGADGSHFYGKVKNLRVYDTALSDEELQNLTTL